MRARSRRRVPRQRRSHACRRLPHAGGGTRRTTHRRAQRPMESSSRA
jgi:hypothetical protein